MMKVEKYERDEIQSLLITPVQRIPRYALLISDLLRHTSADHSDYSNLQIAQEKLKATASYVNSRAELAIELTKIYSIQNSIYGKFDVCFFIFYFIIILLFLFYFFYSYLLFNNFILFLFIFIFIYFIILLLSFLLFFIFYS